MPKLMHVLVVVGTRPEAIKLAPVVLELMARAARIKVTLITTGQHQDLCVDALRTFDLSPDIALSVMQPRQSLGVLTARLFAQLDPVIDREKPDWLIVQGDTTTAFVGAMVAFYYGCKVAHVEAGLRSFDKTRPFPEEVNRVLIGRLADVHFAPTVRSCENLLREGIPSENAFVTGNTIVDAVRLLRSKLSLKSTNYGNLIGPLGRSKLILVTSHRRESHGAALANVCRAVKRLVHTFPEVRVIFPVHPNPSVREVVEDALRGEDQIFLTAPLSYLQLLSIMKEAHLILSDSGGIQEEAPSFGVPLLILRDVTERPEIVECGGGILVGTDSSRIYDAASRLLTNHVAHRTMARAVNPFGDGHAARRIVDKLITLADAQ